MRHLYIHVPFCARRCSYCDFAIAVRKVVPAEEYVAAVTRELELVDDPLEALDTVYLGGGTPSRLPAQAAGALLDAVRARAPLADGAEVTLEANPEDVGPESAAAWRRAGVNRVSLGAQSFDAGVLRWMHRVHGVDRIGDAVRDLRRAGIANVSLDLIFAVPPALERDWERDLALAVALEPEHISLYGLTVEPRTPLARWIDRGAAAPPDDDRWAEEYLLAHDRLGAAGFAFYEVSNAARPGCRSRHNSAYWSGLGYLGVGPAAHSFDGSLRRWNLSAWEAYRRAVSRGQSPVEAREVLSAAERSLEAAYLGLRTDQGVPAATVGPSGPVFVARGWLEAHGDRLRCTPRGWLVLDALVTALTPAGVTL